MNVLIENDDGIKAIYFEATVKIYTRFIETNQNLFIDINNDSYCLDAFDSKIYNIFEKVGYLRIKFNSQIGKYQILDRGYDDDHIVVIDKDGLKYDK